LLKSDSKELKIGQITKEKEFDAKMVKSIYKNDVRCPDEKTAKKK